MLSADFGFRAELNPSHRLFSLEYGGGALLDVGTYLVSFSSMVLGRPSRIVSMAHLGETGVDEQAAIIFGHEGGQLAVLSVADDHAVVTGPRAFRRDPDRYADRSNDHGHRRAN